VTDDDGALSVPAVQTVSLTSLEASLRTSAPTVAFNKTVNVILSVTDVRLLEHSDRR